MTLPIKTSAAALLCNTSCQMFTENWRVNKTERLPSVDKFQQVALRQPVKRLNPPVIEHQQIEFFKVCRPKFLFASNPRPSFSIFLAPCRKFMISFNNSWPSNCCPCNSWPSLFQRQKFCVHYLVQIKSKSYYSRPISSEALTRSMS